jgi:hypothetical protein
MEFGPWLGFLLLNALIFIAWFMVPVDRARGVSGRILLASVLSAAQIIGSIFLLGGPWSKLTAANLVLLNGGFSGGLLVLAAARGTAASSLNDLLAAGSAARDIVMSGTVPKILAALTALVVGWTVFIAVIYPPIEWDALMYHLPAIGHFIQQKSLAEPALPMGLIEGLWIDSSLWVNAFPKNTELLFLWAAIIPGHDALVDLVQLTFGLVGIVAVYALAVRLGVEKRWALSGGFLFFLTPIVIAQSRSNYIDLSNNVLILVALALLYRQAGDRTIAEVAVAGIAAGIVLGSKWSGLVFVPVLATMLAAQRVHWNRRDGRPDFNALAKELLFFIGPALVFGGYWYVKNWYLYANPLWPFELSIFGAEIFRGIITKADLLNQTLPARFQHLNLVQTLWVSWREIGISDYVSDIRPGGLGPFWFILGLPAILYVFRWIAKRGDWAQAAIFLAGAAMVFFHPSAWWTRYTLLVAGLGAICFALVRSVERRPEVTRLIDIMVVVLMVYSTTASIASGYHQPEKIAAVLRGPAESRGPAALRPEIVNPAYGYIAEATAGKPANIAYGTGLYFTYPLWGSRFENKVYYIEATDLASWIKGLRARRIDYLLIKADTPEHDLVGDPKLFKREYLDREEGYAVYSFRG